MRAMLRARRSEPRTRRSATRAGFAAVIGAPNAGKSTLVNRLVGSKVSIVTQKVQTTRFPVRGVAMEGDAPDRAGRHARHLQAAPPAGPRHGPRRLGGRGGRRRRRPPGRRRGRARGAPTAAAQRPTAQAADDTSTDRRGAEGRPARKAILALNKIDLVQARAPAGAVARRLFETGVYSEVFMISAAQRLGRRTT